MPGCCAPGKPAPSNAAAVNPAAGCSAEAEGGRGSVDTGVCCPTACGPCAAVLNAGVAALGPPGNDSKGSLSAMSCEAGWAGSGAVEAAKCGSLGPSLEQCAATTHLV